MSHLKSDAQLKREEKWTLYLESQTHTIGTYSTGLGVLTAKLYHNKGIPRERVHEWLKFMNPIMYDHYKKTIRPTDWGLGIEAWVAFFNEDNKAVACYAIFLPIREVAGYEVRNEALLKCCRGKKVSSKALFPSIDAAIACLPPRGNNVVVAVDMHKPSTAPTVEFLIRECGFALARPRWFGVTQTAWPGLVRTCVSAETKDELVAIGAFNIAYTKVSKVEILLERAVEVKA